MMSRPRNPRAAGLSFLVTGVVFVSVSQVQGLAPFLGVGMAFLGLSFSFLARSRRGC